MIQLRRIIATKNRGCEVLYPSYSRRYNRNESSFGSLYHFNQPEQAKSIRRMQKITGTIQVNPAGLKIALPGKGDQ
jgi:hypothetical protein